MDRRKNLIFKYRLLGVGRGVKWEILSKLLEGLHGVAIGTKKHKSIKIFGLGPHIRYATLTPSRFSIFYINFYIA